MNALQSWGIILAVILGVTVVAMLSVAVIDWLTERFITTSKAQRDVDDLFRRDRARDIMRTWTEDE